MVRIGHSDLRIGSVARFARQLKGDDARHVPLQGEHLQIEHEPGMIGIRGGNADGTVQIRKLVVLGVGLRLLNAAFHFANRLEVLGNFRAVAGTQIAFESAEIFGEGVEQAGPFFERSTAFSEVPPSPKRLSKTMRGCASAGNGVVGDDQERLF